MTLIVRPGFAYDTDASNYIDAVEAADQTDTPGIGAMETAVRYAINDFVIGCKNDGVWTALKNSCILAGAKTLEGSFIDLKSCTKVLTNNNFADGTYSGSNYTTGDYNRETGLLGNSTTKYLNSNRASNADPQDNFHAAVYASTGGGLAGAHLGAVDTTPSVNRPVQIAVDNGQEYLTARSSTNFAGTGGDRKTGLLGVSRSSSSSFTARWNNTTNAVSSVSVTPVVRNIFVFAQSVNGSPATYCSGRLAFYSIGESLDLALLDARVSALITAFGVAIP